MGGDRRIEQALDVIFLGDVARNTEDVAAELGGELLGCLGTPALMCIRDDDDGPLCEAALGCRHADPGASRRSHYDHLASQQVSSLRRSGDGCRFEVVAEAHGAPVRVGLGSAGSPRTRSPMMLRWISFEPP